MIDSVPYVELTKAIPGPGITPTVHEPAFNAYVTDGLDFTSVPDVVVSVLASSFRDSIAIQTAMYDRGFRVRGPLGPTEYPLDVGLPIGQTDFYVVSTPWCPNTGSNKASAITSSWSGEAPPNCSRILRK